MSKMNGELMNGPDQIIPTQDMWTTQADGCVKLKIPKNGKAIETHPPLSVPGMLTRTAEKFPDTVALAYKENGAWAKITYKDYLKLVRTCAKAFLSLGLERYHSVCIMGFNSPEWFISNLGAIFGGGFACGIYTTNSSEASFHVAESSRANIIVVGDETYAEKILSIKDRLPHLKAIIQYSGELNHPDIISWKQLMEIGEKQTNDLLEETLKKIAINECCTLIYTSGTVGNPKAVMLSHDNLVWTATAISERVEVEQGKEVVVSYLPMSHVAAQIIDIYIVILNAATVYFADKNALKGTLMETLREARPTKFLAVPRVWEKIYEKMMQVRETSGPLKRAISSWARGHGLQHYLDQLKGINSNSWGYTLASALIFSKVKQVLGFDRCTLTSSGAAPLSTEIKKYFASLDIPIMEGFGMSESCGGLTFCVSTAWGFETIGTTIPGMKSKLHNVEDGQGELCMYGRQVFMGYLNNEEKTREALDDEGWLHSGDMGRIDEKGFVYITGRLKELIITAGGENVAPVPIEHTVKAELPHVSNVFLVGDQRKFISVLISLKTEVDSNGKPLDTLLPSVQDWLKQLGCPAATVTEVIEAGPSPKLLNALKEGIDRANKFAISNAQKIQKVSIMPVDFSIATGELGPTLKVKRNVVNKKYKDLIDKMYM